MRPLILALPLLSGCVISTGAGYDLQHGRFDNQPYGQYRNISSSPVVGTVRVASRPYKGFSTEYFHASGINGPDHTTVDIISLNYTLTFGDSIHAYCTQD